MKTIGLIGGMSWLTTSHYYSQINRIINLELGGNHSAKCLLHSLDFSEIEYLQNNSRWEEISEIILKSSQNLINCGAELLAFCSNTIHFVADEVQNKINVPIVNIIDATAKQIKSDNIENVVLLGTKFTMEKKFYIDKLKKQYALNVEIPNSDDRKFINRIIFKELSIGLINQKSKDKLISIIKKFNKEGIILACTELPMLIKNTDLDLPIFDTSKIHIEKIVERALK